MNRAELAHYEPTGAGWSWTVAELRRPIRLFAGSDCVQIFRRGNAPALRTEHAKRLWQIICDAPEPIEKGDWLNKAKIFGKPQRHAGHSAIFNLLKGDWVQEDGGFYRRTPR